VPAQRQRLGTAIGDDLDGGVLLDRVGQVDQLAVDAAGKRGAGEPGEIAAATSWTDAPGCTVRFDPSGSVTAI
jgi:hypothetical protein